MDPDNTPPDAAIPQEEGVSEKNHRERSHAHQDKTQQPEVITKIADKNIRLLPQFREKYPDYMDSYSKTSDIHDTLVIEVMETDNDKKEKIIKNISHASSNISAVK